MPCHVALISHLGLSPLFFIRVKPGRAVPAQLLQHSTGRNYWCLASSRASSIASSSTQTAQGAGDAASRGSRPSQAACLDLLGCSTPQTGLFLPFSQQPAKWERSDAIRDCLLWKHATFRRFTSSFAELLIARCCCL